ncbi:unnamed protein product [Dovyalis caffra]|uniref:Uncharacterized protein n=1 Tax=Dovyalis caffra TaxID=77055 RepID=A0AAV1SGK4_9ROSI|nr:unnamed protein product [Dovyalis caffra]
MVEVPPSSPASASPQGKAHALGMVDICDNDESHDDLGSSHAWVSSPRDNSATGFPSSACDPNHKDVRLDGASQRMTTRSERMRTRGGGSRVVATLTL